MYPDPVTIDLTDVTAGGAIMNLSGKEKGEDARKHYHVDEYDKNGNQVIVKVPKDLRGMSTSFFLGLFSKSVKFCGSPNAFYDRFKFDARPTVLKQINRGVDRSLMDLTPFQPD